MRISVRISTSYSKFSSYLKIGNTELILPEGSVQPADSSSFQKQKAGSLGAKRHFCQTVRAFIPSGTMSLRMDSTQPITGAEYDLLVSTLILDHSIQGLNPTTDDKFVDFFLSTGMHPHALAHPVLHRIRLVEGRITWKRPKTRATVSVPVHPRLTPWVEAFVANLPECDRLYYNRLVKRWGKAHGMPDLTPRGLRHTFAYRVYEATGHDLNAAKTLAGTTERVLLNYAKVKEGNWQGKLPPAW